MKKTLALVLCIAMLSILAIMPVMAEQHTAITAPKGTPTIDGVKDDVYSDWVKLAFVEKDDAAGGQIAVAWDDSYIYCIIEVYDKTPFHDNTTNWQTDNVEFFIDWNNHKGESIDNDDEPYWQARIHSAPGEHDYGVTGHSNGAWDNTAEWYDGDNLKVKFVVVGINGKADLSDGYIIEAAFPKAVALAEGKVLGFDAAIGDAVDNDARYSSAFFFSHDEADMPANMWENPSALKALLTLGAAKAAAVVEPEVEAPVVGITPEVPVVTPESPKPTAPKTGDPMVVIIALGSILSAAGVVVSKKRK
jgi:LPXTG-motif cell wall-anchored protein